MEGLEFSCKIVSAGTYSAKWNTVMQFQHMPKCIHRILEVMFLKKKPIQNWVHKNMIFVLNTH